ncbi:hypothetical protein CsSME_00017787 [Camellia sinensis var. sinensis]
MRKRCPYGCSILFFLLCYSFSFFYLHFIVRDRGTFIMLYHQGNDSSTC